MQVIENGKIVRFSLLIHGPVHGFWGSYEVSTRFPEGLSTECAELLKQLQINEKASISGYAINWQIQEPSLIYRISKSQLKGVKEIKTEMVFAVKLPNKQLQGIIVDIQDHDVILDTNPPKVGAMNLVWDIYLTEVREPENHERSADFKIKFKVI